VTTARGRQFSFPPSFLFGTATSATQIEGSCTTSDWYAFAKSPARIKNGDTPDVACDGWHRYGQDIALQKELGLSGYRMSIEWARIEPRPGETDTRAIDTYRAMLGALREAQIEVLVTIHHFTLPLWLAERGGLLAAEFPERLARFARIAADALGDLCRLWVTINEPNVLAAQSYLLGVWPPAKTSLGDALLAQYRLLEGHVQAYRAIKDARGDNASVGIAHHLRIADAARPGSLPDRSAARLLERIFSDAFALALCEGRMLPGVDWMHRRTRRFDVRDARGTHDFLGINYYTRDVVRFSLAHARELFALRGVAPGAEVSDLGWEVYPEGLGRLLRVWSDRSRVPIFVTENGIADATDIKRGPFLVQHLAEVGRALADGVDVRGYFHWSLLDNFEWAEGYTPRFGLVEVDYRTQERRVRESGRLYGRIAQQRRVEL